MNARRESGSWDFSQQQNARNWRKNSSRNWITRTTEKLLRKQLTLTAYHAFIRTLMSQRIFDALQNEKIFIFGEYNRKERKEIESRWSFYSILDSLGRSNELCIVELKSLLHMYGMMSHLIHADQKAIDLVVDEIARPADERRLLRAVHFRRIMSDLISIWTFAYASFRYALGRSPNIPDVIKDNWENATTLGEPLSVAFHDSQKSFYDRVLRSEDEG